MVSTKITLGATVAPVKFTQVEPVLLTDDTILARKAKILDGMKNEGFDALVIYADKEHGANIR